MEQARLIVRVEVIRQEPGRPDALVQSFVVDPFARSDYSLWFPVACKAGPEASRELLGIHTHCATREVDPSYLRRMTQHADEAGLLGHQIDRRTMCCTRCGASLRQIRLSRVALPCGPRTQETLKLAHAVQAAMTKCENFIVTDPVPPKGTPEQLAQAVQEAKCQNLIANDPATIKTRRQQIWDEFFGRAMCAEELQAAMDSTQFQGTEKTYEAEEFDDPIVVVTGGEGQPCDPPTS